MSELHESLLGDRVYQQLRNMLGGDGFRPGVRLPSEVVLAESFSVSRPVLRQALVKLRAEGLIYARKGSGNYVSEQIWADKPIAYGPLLNVPDIREFLAFRSVLEGEICAEAAKRQDEELLEEVRRCRMAHEDILARGEAATDEDIAFHMAIAKAAGNRFYVLTLESLREHMKFGMRLIRDLSGSPLPQRTSQVCDEHKVIEEALWGGDCDAARQAMVSHLKGGIVRLFGKE